MCTSQITAKDLFALDVQNKGAMSFLFRKAELCRDKKEAEHLEKELFKLSK